ncbi:MAG: helix-turn-helix domain-containing protein [Myxococcales bacterium]
MATLDELVRQARRELHVWTHPQFARFLGCSTRTVQRHVRFGGVSQESHYHQIIRAVHPTNPALAAQLAAARHVTLEALGVRPPAPPPDPTRREHADSVVCAAADVLQLPPSAVRPAVAAAFARASELEVTFAGLAKLLAGAPPKPKPRAKPGG